MNYFQIISLVLPLVMSLIKSFEHTDAPGPDKKVVVVDQLKTAYEVLRSSGSIKEIKDVPWESIEPIVAPLIDSLVSGIKSLKADATPKV